MRDLIRRILKEESDKQTDLANTKSSDYNICDDFSAESYKDLVQLINKAHVSKEDHSKKRGQNSSTVANLLAAVDWNQDYIRTAWAKGLGERAVIIRHALKNGLIPVITLAGTGVSHILGGSVIIENVFAIIKTILMPNTISASAPPTITSVFLLA